MFYKMETESMSQTVFTTAPEKIRIKINKAKATFTGRSPRHTQVGHPEDTQQNPGVKSPFVSLDLMYSRDCSYFRRQREETVA
jgi:hypothetical protein